MKKKCKRCGETFYDEGEETAYSDPQYQNVCNDCFQEDENLEPVYDSISDADSGL